MQFRIEEQNAKQPKGQSPEFAEAARFVVTRARELVNQLLLLNKQQCPPFPAKDLAKLHGIKDVISVNLGESDGMLVRAVDGYIIKVNTNHHELRKNFSCAHEIGHTFLDELDRHDLKNHIDWRGNTFIAAKDKERLCNIAAAELLMPENVFGEYLADFGLSIDSVEQLARIFKVSIPATAIRVQEISKERCYVIRWKRWNRPKSKGFIQDRSREVARRTYIRDPSALLKAYESNVIIRSYKHLTIDGRRKRCLLESKGFGREKDRYVLSLVFLGR